MQARLRFARAPTARPRQKVTALMLTSHREGAPPHVARPNTRTNGDGPEACEGGRGPRDPSGGCRRSESGSGAQARGTGAAAAGAAVRRPAGRRPQADRQGPRQGARTLRGRHGKCARRLHGARGPLPQARDALDALGEMGTAALNMASKLGDEKVDLARDVRKAKHS